MTLSSRDAKKAASLLLSLLVASGAASPAFAAAGTVRVPAGVRLAAPAVRAPLNAAGARAFAAPASFALDVPAAPAAASGELARSRAGLLAAQAAPAAAAAVSVSAVPAERAPRAEGRFLRAEIAHAVRQGELGIERLFGGAAPAASLAADVPADALGAAGGPRSPRGVLMAKPRGTGGMALRLAPTIGERPAPQAAGVAPRRGAAPAGMSLGVQVRGSVPAREKAVEKALRALIDKEFDTGDGQRHGTDDMAKVRVELVPGEKGEPDTYYAVFRQWKLGKDQDGNDYYLFASGGSVTFVLKDFGDGRPVIVDAAGQVHKDVPVDVMSSALSDEKLLETARAAAAPRPEAGPPQYVMRELTNAADGTWRALNVYLSENAGGEPVVVAVDVKTGEAFVFNARSFKGHTHELTDLVGGIGNVATETGADRGPAGEIPLPHAHVYDAKSGRLMGVTDLDGRVTYVRSPSFNFLRKKWASFLDLRQKLKVGLKGRFVASLTNADASDAPVEVLFKRGEKAVLNAAADATVLAAVNAYVYFTRHMRWLMDTAGLGVSRLDQPIPGGITVNDTKVPGNAYFTPIAVALVFAAAAVLKIETPNGIMTVKVGNTAQPSIIRHEGSHYAENVLSQVALTAAQKADPKYAYVRHAIDNVSDGAIGEGQSDVAAMMQSRNPVVGNGYREDMPDAGNNFIRTGENVTQITDAEVQEGEVHKVGEILMGFAWKVFAGLVETGYAPEEASRWVARNVLRSTLLSQPADVVAAVRRSFLAALRKDGTIAHAAVLAKAAMAHGLTPEMLGFGVRRAP